MAELGSVTGLHREKRFPDPRGCELLYMLKKWGGKRRERKNGEKNHFREA